MLPCAVKAFLRQKPLLLSLIHTPQPRHHPGQSRYSPMTTSSNPPTSSPLLPSPHTSCLLPNSLPRRQFILPPLGEPLSPGEENFFLSLIITLPIPARLLSFRRRCNVDTCFCIFVTSQRYLDKSDWCVCVCVCVCRSVCLITPASINRWIKLWPLRSRGAYELRIVCAVSFFNVSKGAGACAPAR
jgi:hypothetical protein